MYVCMYVIKMADRNRIIYYICVLYKQKSCSWRKFLPPPPHPSFWQVVDFVACRYFGEQQIFCACAMPNIFLIFQNWARHRLLDVPRLTREKVAAPSTFSAPVPILGRIYMTKKQSAVLKILGTGANFQGLPCPKRLSCKWALRSCRFIAFWFCYFVFQSF